MAKRNKVVAAARIVALSALYVIGGVAALAALYVGWILARRDVAYIREFFAG